MTFTHKKIRLHSHADGLIDYTRAEDYSAAAAVSAGASAAGSSALAARSTHSIIAIGAESDMRAPSLVMRQ
jgi:hypothetical protein